eukprot:1825840-Pleurochrysis_carterae.AAC.3
MDRRAGEQRHRGLTDPAKRRSRGVLAEESAAQREAVKASNRLSSRRARWRCQRQTGAVAWSLSRAVAAAVGGTVDAPAAPLLPLGAGAAPRLAALVRGGTPSKNNSTGERGV